MRNFSDLKLRRFGRPVPTACSQPDIDRFEARYDVRLPRAYAQLLLYSNGGYPAANVFPLPPGSEDSEFAINDFYYLLPDVRTDPQGGSGSNLWFRMEVAAGYLPPKSVPIAADAFGNEVFLDVSEDPAPVFVRLHDPDEGSRVADSFEAFLDLLRPES